MTRTHLTEVVLARIPDHGCARIDACPILLHDDTRNDVLVRLVERLQLF